MEHPVSHAPSRALVLLFALPLVTLALLTEEVAEGEPFRWDWPALIGVHRLNGVLLDAVMALFTVSGAGIGLAMGVAVTVFALLLRGRHGQILFLIAAVEGASLVERTLKASLAKPRPGLPPGNELGWLHWYQLGLLVAMASALVLVWRVRSRRWAMVLAGTFLVAVGLSEIETLWTWATPAGGYSFPSGHATGSMALTAVFVMLAWPTRGRWWALLGGAVYAIGVGLSRLHLGVHFPSDILAGWAVALAWVAGIRLFLPDCALNWRSSRLARLERWAAGEQRASP